MLTVHKVKFWLTALPSLEESLGWVLGGTEVQDPMIQSVIEWGEIASASATIVCVCVCVLLVQL